MRTPVARAANDNDTLVRHIHVYQPVRQLYSAYVLPGSRRAGAYALSTGSHKHIYARCGSKQKQLSVKPGRGVRAFGINDVCCALWLPRSLRSPGSARRIAESMLSRCRWSDVYPCASMPRSRWAGIAVQASPDTNVLPRLASLTQIHA